MRVLRVLGKKKKPDKRRCLSSFYISEPGIFPAVISFLEIAGTPAILTFSLQNPSDGARRL